MSRPCRILMLIVLSGLSATVAAKVDLLGYAPDSIVQDEYLIHFRSHSRHHFERVSNSFHAIMPNATKMGVFSRSDKLLLIHARMDGDDLRRAELLDSVQDIYPNVMHKMQDGGRELGPMSWGLDRIDGSLNNAFEWQSDGSNVGIAILDTGINTEHPDWTSNGAASRVEFLGDCHDSSELSACKTSAADNPGDPQGHGTHVAGIAGSNTYGVARGATIYAVRVLGTDGTGVTTDIVRGIQLVEDHAEQNPSMRFVINLSLGGGRDPALNLAVENAYDNGIVMIAAAGNENGVNACNVSPAGAARVIAVGATTSADVRSSFTNLGPCVDVFAPGTGIRSLRADTSQGTFVVFSGTSMAAPHVSGVAAMILSGNPTLTSADVEGILMEVSARDVISDLPTDSPNRLLQIPQLEEMTIPPESSSIQLTLETTTRVGTPAPSNAPECLPQVNSLAFDDARRWYGAMFDITISNNGIISANTGVRITRFQVTAHQPFQDETLEVYVTRDRVSFRGNEVDPDPWERLALITGVDATSAGEVLDFDIGALGEWDFVIDPEQFGQPIGVYVTLMNMNSLRYYANEDSQIFDLTLVDDSILTMTGGVAVEYPWTTFVGPRYFAGSVCYDLVSTLLPEPVDSEDGGSGSGGSVGGDGATDDNGQGSTSDTDYLGECLVSAPTSTAGNNNHGVMFDVTVPNDLIDGAEIILDNILLGVTDTLDGATIEIYATIDPLSYKNVVNQSFAWQLVQRIDNVQSTGSGSIVDFGMELNFMMTDPGSTHGFYVTFTEENPSMLYYNVPERGVFADGQGLIVSGGIGMTYPFGETYVPRQFSGSVCYRMLVDGQVVALQSASSATTAPSLGVFVGLFSLLVLAFGFDNNI